MTLIQRQGMYNEMYYDIDCTCTIIHNTSIVLWYMYYAFVLQTYNGPTFPLMIRFAYEQYLRGSSRASYLDSCISVGSDGIPKLAYLSRTVIKKSNPPFGWQPEFTNCIRLSLLIFLLKKIEFCFLFKINIPYLNCLLENVFFPK